MPMPPRTRTRMVRLVSARAGAVSGAHVLGSFEMEEACVRHGRWPPWRRRLQPRAEEVAELHNTILDEEKDFELRLVSSLACARVEADPLRGLDGRARVASEKLLVKNGFGRAAQPSWS